MNSHAIQVRPARSDDRDCILVVHLDAFGGDEGPVIVSLLQEMLDDPTAEPMHSFVAESNDKIGVRSLWRNIDGRRPSGTGGTTGYGGMPG
ncbi:hypothetical protein [Roseiconus lacunae]|uniref:hypothetical protein n=1 Tax=Roseiconus lacunae TaxID=2605694 RepID=UPI001E40A309|nr:hypothetical protein [Roseiconus lacunae]